jgi:hypothetical protein
MGKTAFKFGWTGNGLLATASNGFGLTVKADNHKTAELLLKKREKAHRRQLFKK